MRATVADCGPTGNAAGDAPQVRFTHSNDQGLTFITVVREIGGHVAEVKEKPVQEPMQEPHRRHESVQIYLDGVLLTTSSRRLTGRQIRELGPTDRVDGFETQKVDTHGKKERTIGDNEEVELHEHERFRTVPNHGGPGASF